MVMKFKKWRKSLFIFLNFFEKIYSINYNLFKVINKILLKRNEI